MKIAVLGGGPGGYVAALYAAIKGAEVTLIEKESFGGTCLNRGCIPTKAFLKGTEALKETNEAAQFGIIGGTQAEVDYAKIYNRKELIVTQLVGGVGFLLKKRGVKVVNGFGKLVTNHTIEVTKQNGEVEQIEADKVILATGSNPVIPPMFGYDGKLVYSSDEALKMQTLPKSVIIVGGGVIGCEFGQFYARMGVDVTIVELAEHILPLEDKDVAETLKKALKAEGIKILEKIGIQSVTKSEGVVSAELTNGEVVQAEGMLLSVGRKANITKMGFEELNIETSKGKIVVNEKMETSVTDVYAIGDIVDTPFLAHVASREGIVAVENALGYNSKMSYKAIPRCIYTSPEVSAVGITEAQAKQMGITYKVGKFNFAGIGKAMVAGKTEGFVKVIVDDKGIIVGGQIVGAHATELLGELTMAVHIGLHIDVASEIVHAHPTMSEAIMEAFHDVEGHSVHQY